MVELFVYDYDDPMRQLHAAILRPGESFECELQEATQFLIESAPFDSQAELKYNAAVHGNATQSMEHESVEYGRHAYGPGQTSGRFVYEHLGDSPIQVSAVRANARVVYATDTGWVSVPR